jgi:hypothetical protein
MQIISLDQMETFLQIIYPGVVIRYLPSMKVHISAYVVDKCNFDNYYSLSSHLKNFSTIKI